MSRIGRDVPDRVKDMLEAIGNVRSDIGDIGNDEFLADGKTQRAVIESIVVIGEAANHILRLEPSLEQTNRSLWQHCREAYDMRIVLTHEYFRVDAAIVWTTVESQLPQLESILVAFLDKADRSGDGAPGQGEA